LVRSFAQLLRELSRLRAYRSRRRESIPFRFALRWYQRHLARRLAAEWRESYVLLDDGDFFHIPAALDMHAQVRLLQPAVAPPLIAKFCRPGDTAIDVGANIGQWAVPMAKRVGESGRVFAFEPNPLLAESLRRTFRVNALAHAEAQALALSDGAGEATLHVVNASPEGIVDSGVSSLERPAPGSLPVRVRTVALDEFLKGREVRRIGLIKIDVEGHEARVLAGARATLREHAPALVIETGFESGEQRGALAALLREAGYAPVGVIHDRHLAPAGWDAYLAASEPFRAKRVMNLLLLPEKP
jgi:FkbM family methyltransferase